jgi:hypothetical protein
MRGFHELFSNSAAGVPDNAPEPEIPKDLWTELPPWTRFGSNGKQEVTDYFRLPTTRPGRDLRADNETAKPFL